MITIKDVAKSAGVSISTVSKVINDSHEISDKTKELVNEHIKILGYFPNSSARNLARKYNKNIIYLTNLNKNSAFENPHSFEIINGIYSILEKKGYSLQIKGMNSKEYLINSLNTIIYEKKADGIIIHSSSFYDEFEKILNNTNFPHIIIGKPENISSLSWVDINNVSFGNFATDYLIKKNYIQIAYIGGNEKDLISEHRLSGVKSCIHKNNLNLIFINHDNRLSENNIQILSNFKNKSIRAAVICANNLVAFNLTKDLRERNFAIPDDVAILTFDDYPYSKISEPKLSTIDVDVFDLGKECAKNLVKIINNPHIHIEFNSTLPSVIEREST